jgi:crotonobetainyl-CoA:carnitine CoA-transferase CaiB-like acyl-CoA transferase
MLSSFKVLDLTDEKGFLCGKALGDLGADVIKIERPGGDPSRRRGPFYHDIPDPEKSLYWFAFNASKRGITLDIETSDGREIFKTLAKKADVIIESFAPGYMEKTGLGYSTLNQINPGMILTSISGFGQNGPYSNYNDRDIAVWALSGFMFISGEPDRPPLVPSYPHAHLVGAMNGAVGTMIALCQRQLTGEGQWVDASTQQGLCFAISVQTKVPWAMNKVIATRQGRDRSHIIARDGETDLPLIWECKDGDVAYSIMFIPEYEQTNKAIADWIKEDGIDTGVLGRWDWKTEQWKDHTLADAKEVNEVLSGFFKRHTKKELNDTALLKRVQLTPVLTPKDQLEFPQLKVRDFWIDVEHPELGTSITYPGSFAKPGAGECRIRRRAPLIGEHNKEIYQDELGFSDIELVNLKQRGII